MSLRNFRKVRKSDRAEEDGLPFASPTSASASASASENIPDYDPFYDLEPLSDSLITIKHGNSSSWSSKYKRNAVSVNEPRLPPTMDLDALPTEVIELLFEKLMRVRFAEKLHVLAWRRASNLIQVTKRLHETFMNRVEYVMPLDHGYVDRSRLVWSLARYARNLRLLDLTVLNCQFTQGSMKLELIPKVFELLAVNCKRLHTLVLTGCYIATDTSYYFPYMNSLNNLDLSYTNITDDILYGVSLCKKLQVLDITECPELTDQGIAQLQTMNNLLKVYSSHGYKLTNNALDTYSTCKFICLLDLSHITTFTDMGIQTISKALSHLQIIYLAGCTQITDAGVSCLTRCKELKNLDLSFCTQLSDSACKWLGYLYPLEHLILTGCTGISTEGVLSLKHLKKLINLNLSACCKVTDGIAPVILNLPKLAAIDLSFCIEITDEIVNAIGAHPSLRTINLQRCKKISTRGASALSLCHSVESIFLGGCSRIRDEGIVDYTSLPNLTMLFLDRCERITDVAMDWISLIPNLEHLFIKGVTLLTNEGLESISRLGDKLKILNISECPGITDKGMKTLTQACKNIHTLEIAGNNLGDNTAYYLTHLRHLSNLNFSESSRLTDTGCKYLAAIKTIDTINLSKCDQLTQEGARAISKLYKLRAVDIHFVRTVSYQNEIQETVHISNHQVEYFSLRDCDCSRFLLLNVKTGWAGGATSQFKYKPKFATAETTKQKHKPRNRAGGEPSTNNSEIFSGNLSGGEEASGNRLAKRILSSKIVADIAEKQALRAGGSSQAAPRRKGFLSRLVSKFHGAGHSNDPSHNEPDLEYHSPDYDDSGTTF